MKWKWLMTTALAMLLVAGCGGFGGETQTPDTGSQNDGSSESDGWKDVRLANSKAKPFDPIVIENLPDGVEGGDLYVDIYPGDAFETDVDSFPGLVTYASDGEPASPSEGQLSVFTPFLPSPEKATVEVVVTDGESRSERLPLEVQAIDVDEGAFAEAQRALEKTVMEMVRAAEVDESQLQSYLRGKQEFPRKWFPLAVTYHVVVDPKNPNALVNREFDDEQRRVLDAFATRFEMAELAGHARNAYAPPQPRGGATERGDGADLGFEPVEVKTARQLSERLDEYYELKEKIEKVEAFQTAFGVFVAIATAPAVTGAGVIAAALGPALTTLGITMNVYKYMESTKLGQLPCCLLDTSAKFKDGAAGLATTKLGEDEAIPQLTVESVKTTAWSTGMNFQSKTLDTLYDFITDRVGNPGGNLWNRGVGTFAKRLEGTPVDDLGEHYASEAANDAWNSLVDSLPGSSEVHYEWDVTLYEYNIGDTKWVQTRAEGPNGRPTILRPYNGDDSSVMEWELNPETAYPTRESADHLVLTPDPENFRQPVPPEEYPSAEKPVQLEPIEVKIEPKYSVVDRSKTYIESVVVEHAEDTELSEIDLSAGEMVEYYDWSNHEKSRHEYEWKTPAAKEKYPVELEVKSLSDEGLRGKVEALPGREPPERIGTAQRRATGFVDLYGGTCLSTGGSTDLTTAVAPADETLVWSASAGNLEVADDTHSAVFEAPDSATEVDIEVHHQSDETASDSETVRVRETCTCTYDVTVAGMAEHHFDGPEGADEPIQALALEDKGLFAASYGGDQRVTVVKAPDLPAAALEEGTDTFRGAFAYAEADGSVGAGTDSAVITVEWRGEHDMRTKITASGRVKGCKNCLDGGGEQYTRFKMTMYAPVKRFENEGTSRLANCSGEVRKVPAQPDDVSAPEMPDVPGIPD